MFLLNFSGCCWMSKSIYKWQYCKLNVKIDFLNVMIVLKLSTVLRIFETDCQSFTIISTTTTLLQFLDCQSPAKHYDCHKAFSGSGDSQN